MKLISWNVNGLRACVKKGFLDFFKQENADIFCIQETKLQPGQIELDLPGYSIYFSSADKKGYSGTAMLVKKEPLSLTYGLGIDAHDHEGRTICAEYEGFRILTVYTPNSQNELARLPYRVEWERDFRAYAARLAEDKPLIICGDMNVAHREIDLKSPKTNAGNAGFTPEERGAMTELLNAGFTDSFRYKYPDREGAYTWWSYRTKGRETNSGWRIDYFLVSDAIRDKISDGLIYSDVEGSDHCPIGLEIDL